MLTVPASRKVTKKPGGRTRTALSSGALISAAAPPAMTSGKPPALTASGISRRPAEPLTPSTANVVRPPP